MKISGIYGIRNTVNGKWYVGQSVDIKSRKKNHFSYLRHSKSANEFLQRSFIKYGENNFEFHILEEIAENMLDIRECAWIDYYKSGQEQFGYNLMTGGNPRKHHSEKTCRKISLAVQGKSHPQSEQTRQSISKALNGHGVSAESRRKMSVGQKANISDRERRKKWGLSTKGKHRPPELVRQIAESLKGHECSKETRRKISEANTGKHPSKETLQKLSEIRKGRPWSKLRRERYINKHGGKNG